MTSLSLRLFYNGTSSQKILKLSKSFLVHFALISLIFEQLLFVASASAQALPINPDGTTNTQVTQTASGVDQVNIAAPNANGLSHNKFTDYNVNTGGQIINNFSGRDGVASGSAAGSNAVTQTQIGGLVTVNPNFSDGVSAKVILNEVTSGNNTQLLGYTEIAGSKADLIIANPNGISCRGCGFLSTSHLTFVAGSSNFDSSGNLGFNLKEQTNPNLLVPLITVDGLGLDITNTTSTDIIASSIKLLANVYGSDNTTLTVKSGEGRYDYQTKEIANSTTSLASGTTPLFAIDASSLAKIQSGRIFIVATKEGVGVNMASEVLASNEVNIDANGDVYYANISAGNKVSITSTKNISSLDSNSIISAPNLTLKSGAEFKNLGNLSAYNLDILNSGTLTNSGQIEALALNLSNITNINNFGSFYGENSLNISGTNLTNNFGASIFSPQSYSIALTGLLTNSAIISSGNDLTISSNQITNNSNSEISAQNDLSFVVADSLTNSGNLIASNALNVTANSLTNNKLIQSGGLTTFNLATLTNSENSLIYSDDNFDLELSYLLTNLGEISATKKLTITGAASLTNSNQISASGLLSITGRDLTNNSGAVISSTSDEIKIILSANLQNYGELNAKKDLTINAKNLSNSGNILATENLNLTIDELLTNSTTANLQSTKDLDLKATTLENAGSIKAFAKSTINTAELTNQIAAVIYSANDASEIKASDSLTNHGNILSSKNLLLSGNQIKNDGEVSVGGDLSFTLLSTFIDASLENKGSLKSLSKIDINNSSKNFTSAVNNSSEILSGTSLSVTTTTLENSSKLQSSGTLTLTLKDLTNYSDIKSSNLLTIKASGDVTNEALIQSAAGLTIEASSFNNALASSLVLANQDLSISAASVKNKNTKPINGIISAGLVSVDGELSIKADELNNESGIITGKTTKLAALNNPKLNFISTSGSLFASGSIDVNMGDEDYKNEGEVTAKNVNVTANNIFNYGSLVASEFITFNANGINGGGSIFNGYDATTPDSANLNKNILLAAGTYIDFTAKNNIENYGTISSATKLNLTATNGSVNNYNNAKVTGGNDAATITALNGGFYNLSASSLFTSNNNATFNVKDLSNSGEISVANNLTTNITNNLNNNTSALIWTSGDATFNVDNIFSNNQAAINIGNNLVIQNRSSAKNNKVENKAGGEIEALGTFTIRTKELLNEKGAGDLTVFDRTEFEFIHKDTNNTADPSDDTVHTNHDSGGPFFYKPGYHSGLNLSSGRFNDGYQILIGGLTWWDHRAGIDRTIYLNKENTSLVRSNLTSKGNMFIYADKITNDYSNIQSGGNLLMEGSSLDNKTSQIISRVKYHCHDGSEWCDIQNAGADFDRSGNFEFNKVTGSINSYIKAGGSFTGSFTAKIDNDAIKQNASVSAPDFAAHSTNFNKIDAYTLGETGVINLDLSSITAAINSKNSSKNLSEVKISEADSNPSDSDTIFSGTYKINLDHASTKPLIESRSQFTDVSKFFGSKYYFDQLGLDGAALLSDIDRQSRDPSQNSRMLGDAFAESQLIIKQLRTLTNDSLLLSKNITNTDEQIKELLDNSIAEIARLGLNATDIATKGLTKDQANSLTKDIVTFETTKVNGISVLAPKIYLSLATRNRLLGDEGALAKNSVIFAKEDLTINSPTATLTNNGTISSGGNLILNVANFNSAPQIVASPALVSPTATALRSSKFASLGSNQASGQTSNSNTLSAPTYQTDYNTNAAIKSGGNLVISANDSLALKNTSLNSGGLISLSAARDITLANNQDFSLAQTSLNQLLAKSLPVAETNAGSPTFSISSSAIKDEAAAARSLAIFNAASDIEIISGGSIKVANNYSNTSGSIFMTAANDITNTNYTIKASDNVVMNATNIKNSYDAKRHSSNYGSPINDWTNEAKIESSGSIALNATGNISLQNSILDSKNKISLNGADINIFNDPIKSVITAATSTKSDILFTTSSIKDDAESTRSAITFNAISDIELNSTGSINIANNYLNTSGSIFMTAASDINNSNYTIKAADNVVMSATNINNIHKDTGYTTASGATTNETRIEAGSMVSLNATNDINNIGATIKAGDLLYLTAGNDINNQALVNYKINGSSTNADGSTITETQALASDARNISSTLVGQGNLTAGGNLVLVAGNDINNKGSNITATGSSYLEATTGDINVTTAALRDKTFAEGGGKKKHWVRVTDNTTNIESSVSSGGTLDLASLASDINIKGSSLTSADNLTLTAKNDVNITSAQDSTYSYSAGRTGKGKSYLNRSESTTQIGSDLTTTNNGDISITSGYLNSDTIGATGSKGSISLIASNLTTKDTDNNSLNNSGSGDINLTAKEDINISSALDYKHTEVLSGKKTTWIKKSHGEEDITLTNVSSNISASGDAATGSNAGDINLNSGNNTTITASNLAGENGNIIVGKYVDPTDSTTITYNPNALLTIKSGQDYHRHVTTDMKIKKDAGAVVVGAVAAVAVAYFTAGLGVGLIGAAGGGAMIGGQSERGRTMVNITNETTQKMSTLTFNSDLSTQSGSDTTITASKLSADNATILTGKFRDSLGADTITDSSAKLNVNSAFNTYDNTTTIHQVKPNYVGVAVVAAASQLASQALANMVSPVNQFGMIGPQIPTIIMPQLIVGGASLTTAAAAKIGGDVASNSLGLIDPLFNLRSKDTYSTKSSTEIKTDLNFNNLITE